MKILYITNGINGSGGLERVLSIKASYLADSLGYQVHILVLNEAHLNPFYTFSSSLQFHSIAVSGNPINYFLKYKKGIKKLIKRLNPHVISVCDDGLKGMLFPIIFGKNIPVIFERHVSKQIEIKKDKLSFIDKIKSISKFRLMNFTAGRFDKFVVLTKGNLQDWNLKNTAIIPNPLPFNESVESELSNKKILAVGKQSYQKGYDRLLKIWQLVSTIYPEWELDVYGKLDSKLNLEKLACDLGVDSSVNFFPPVKKIKDVYMESSIYVMTSRFEGFGMVIIEAMSFGIPCISFDCPHGPSDIIKHGENGFLVANGDIDTFARQLMLLIENIDLRKKFGEMAKENVIQYSPEKIIGVWDDLFKSLKMKK